MYYQAEMTITKKDLSFISDIDLRNVLLQRLNELDRVFMANANLSTIFLSISTVEGIFNHLFNIFKSKIKDSGSYPKYTSGKKMGQPKKVKDITIDDMYLLFKELDLLPDIKDFEQVYRLFRNYRNFIHPQKQSVKDWPSDLGQAQMAIGLLTATVDYLSRFIFIKQLLFEKISGSADFSNNDVLNLPRSDTRQHSFVVLRSPITERLSLNFDLELPEGSILNFVFNFKDEGDFKMIRLDQRIKSRYRNCLLYCPQKYGWYERFHANVPHAPLKNTLHVEIEIDKTMSKFDFKVDKTSYSFLDNKNATIDLFKEFKPNLLIGFFNEELLVKITNISISL
ncbi:MAG: hypothetical protein ABSB10_03480 [Candidatus Bathyarchaeia archaeon]